MFSPSMSMPSCYKNIKMLIFYRGDIMEDWGHVDLKLDEFMKKIILVVLVYLEMLKFIIINY